MVRVEAGVVQHHPLALLVALVLLNNSDIFGTRKIKAMILGLTLCELSWFGLRRFGSM
jgi:hypothetical protein